MATGTTFKRIATAIHILSTQGFVGLISRLKRKRREWEERRRYRNWQQAEADLFGQAGVSDPSAIERLRTKPLISILLPVYNIDAKWLRCCIDSVLEQTYEKWELCIADDASDLPHVASVLNEYARSDPRIKIVFRRENGHISASSNSALEMASGELCVLLDHDDELSRDALFWVAHELDQHPDAQMIYSDEDLLDTHGRRYSPSFKPDFSRDLLYSLNLVTHLCAYRTPILRRIGGFRVGFEGSQDYDVALRVLEQIQEDQIRHIPKILYHWRVIEGSVALSGEAKPYAHERAREAIREHILKLGKTASVKPSDENLHRVTYEIPVPRPSLSIFLIGPDQGCPVERPDFLTEINAAQSGEVCRIGGDTGLANQLNTAVYDSEGSVIIFLRNGPIPADREWLDELTGFAMQPEIGCVGGKVVNEIGEVVAGGLVLGGDRIVNTAHAEFPPAALGNMYRNCVIGNFSAVSLWAMAMRREVFDGVGGFDSTNLSNHFLDADICLRLRENGFRIVHTPYARFCTRNRFNVHSAPSEEEIAYFSKRWGHVLSQDPFGNPNLKPDGTFSINA